MNPESRCSKIGIMVAKITAGQVDQDFLEAPEADFVVVEQWQKDQLKLGKFIGKDGKVPHPKDCNVPTTWKLFGKIWLEGVSVAVEGREGRYKIRRLSGQQVANTEEREVDMACTLEFVSSTCSNLTF